jgi:glycerophosphoryl diester phosphodiesterase
VKRILIALSVAASVSVLAACDAVVSTEPLPASELSTLAPNDLPAFFDCLRERGFAIVSAHRGGPEAGFVENALSTMEKTLIFSPAFLEIDIARTKDGALVLMHDDEVDRTTNGVGRVSDLTLAEFQALSLEDEGDGVLDEHPPTLRQALDWADSKTVLELDVKRGVSYEDVVAAVREAGAMHRVIFIVYSVDGAARIASVAPEAMIYATVRSEEDLDELEARGVDLANVVAWTGTEEPNSALNVALAQRGVEARFGTLGGENSWDRRFSVGDSQGEYSAFAETGIQIIATDYPNNAARDLDRNDGVEGHGAKQCEAAQ